MNTGLFSVVKTYLLTTSFGLTSAYCACKWILDKVGDIVPVKGASMQPTLNPEDFDNDSTNLPIFKPDWVLLRRINERFSSLRRGDVVTVADPHDRRQVFIKRIVGLEGDVVETLRYRTRRVSVPEGHCWVEGDNHEKSIDSNDFGPVPLALITGKAIGIVNPWDRKRFLTHQLDPNSAQRVQLSEGDQEATA